VAELTVRLVFSLAVVLGLLMLCARLAGRRFQGRQDTMVQVVHRQHISRNASVSVVNVAGRVLVLGSTDSEVRLLTELDPNEVDGSTETAVARTDPATLTLVTDLDSAESVRPLRMDVPAADVLLREQEAQQQPVARPGRHLASREPRPARKADRMPDQQRALSGSVLSVRTWRQAWGAVSGRAS
jgi:flagellar protein FliO/FliZ